MQAPKPEPGLGGAREGAPVAARRGWRRARGSCAGAAAAAAGPDRRISERGRGRSGPVEGIGRNAAAPALRRRRGAATGIRIRGVVTNWSLVTQNHDTQSCMDPQARPAVPICRGGKAVGREVLGSGFRASCLGPSSCGFD